MTDTLSVRIRGEYACFTRPEMKVERVSYDVITPSAARGVLEAILWKPEMRWQVTRIEVLAPIRWLTLRRNEVKNKVSARSATSAMKTGGGHLGLYVDDDSERVQRGALLLRDVDYIVHARCVVKPEARSDNLPLKYCEMLQRRLRAGQCFRRPYLGTREFPADFAPVEDASTAPSPITESRDLGWMLHDFDYTQSPPHPRFFRASMEHGVIDVPDWSDPGLVQ